MNRIIAVYIGNLPVVFRQHSEEQSTLEVPGSCYWLEGGWRRRRRQRGGGRATPGSWLPLFSLSILPLPPIRLHLHLSSFSFFWSHSSSVRHLLLDCLWPKRAPLIVAVSVLLCLTFCLKKKLKKLNEMATGRAANSLASGASEARLALPKRCWHCRGAGGTRWWVSESRLY